MNIMKLLLSCLMLLVAPMSARADAPALFNQAIADAGRIRTDAPTKERLSAYEKVLEALDEIVREFPGSDEARLILSGQDTGNFSPSKMRAGYIQELTDYYDIVCEAAPSYTCLAFVSLKSGSDRCSQAQTVADIDSAYKHLASALRIFSAQSENNAFASVTVTTARQCAARDLDAWTRDYFGSKLAEMLLVSGDESTARAVIENMTTPYFKFEGVLALKTASKSLVDQAYLDRLERFIDENLGQAGAVKAPTDAFLATLRLRSFAISNSEVTMEYGYVYDAIQKYRNYGDKRTCDSQYVSYLFNMLLDYQTEVALIPQSRRGINDSQIENMVDMIASRTQSVLSTCADGDYYDLKLMAQIHGRLLVLKGEDRAMAFRNMLDARSLTREELIEYYLAELNPTAEELISSYFLEDGSHGRSGPIWYIADDVAVGNGLEPQKNPATFPVFQRLVDLGEVCRSSEILFRRLSGTDRFDSGIQYMIDSPVIDGTKRHSCGDEDLELLLE